MEMILANRSKVKVSVSEIQEYVTEVPCPIPNPYWRYSELLTEEEVMRYLAGESDKDKLQKIARYILIFTENLAFTAHLYDKSEGHDNGRKLNMPALEKLRGFYRTISNGQQTRDGIARLVHEMESVCLEIGAGPL